MKRYLKVAVIFLLGVILGVAAASIWWCNSCNTVKDFLIASYVTSEMQAAYEQYMNGKPQVAIYALTRALDATESNENNSFLLREDSARFHNWDKALINARLARTYRKIGDEESSAACFTKAIDLFAEMGWRFNDIIELNEAIDLVDSGRVVDAIKTYGQVEN